MSTHENLIKAGLDLFHRYGIHPVGLDRILQKAGVTKTTFYNHFESKETFACAVIDSFGEQIREKFDLQRDGGHDRDVKQQLLLAFDLLQEATVGKPFSGCLLVCAGVSSGDANDPVRQAAVRNKLMLSQVFRKLASEAGIKDPRRFASRFSLLFDGAAIARQLYGDRSKVEEARKMAEQMIDEELAKVR